MQANPTYPGVYVDEISSGVRTITGVSTSVAAFLGKARTGPINKPERILSFADYERKFGGLDSNSEMSYAVLQFFNNGGSNAWVVRLAKDTSSAALILNNRSTDPVDPVLSLTALNAGFDGNNIRVSVDPIDNSSGFNMTLEYRVSGRRPIVERFENLSMNSKDPHYVVDQINQESKLVEAERPDNVTLPGDGDFGILKSGVLSDVVDLVDEHHNQFRISINGLPAITIQLSPLNDLTNLADQITTKVSDPNEEALEGFTCAMAFG